MEGRGGGEEGRDDIGGKERKTKKDQHEHVPRYADAELKKGQSKDQHEHVPRYADAELKKGQTRGKTDHCRRREEEDIEKRNVPSRPGLKVRVISMLRQRPLEHMNAVTEEPI